MSQKNMSTIERMDFALNAAAALPLDEQCGQLGMILGEIIDDCIDELDARFEHECPDGEYP